MSDTTVTAAHTSDAVPARPSSPADRLMRRVLRLPEGGPRATAAEARKAFQTSIAVTAIRCLLMYIVLPFVLPAVGIATGAAPIIVLPVNVIAIVMIVMSMRRFWRADHPKRWWYTVLGTTVIAFLLVVSLIETAELVF